MLLIGNQLRLTRDVLAAAVSRRYQPVIKSLARQQVEAGATWLLVDVGPQRKDADDDLVWLVEAIHDEVSIPLVELIGNQSDRLHRVEVLPYGKSPFWLKPQEQDKNGLFLQ